MRLYLISLILIAVFFGGCCEKCVDVPDLTPDKKCYTFDRKLSIKVDDLNSTHGAISWEDTTKIENFLKAKKTFNTNVVDLNSK